MIPASDSIATQLADLAGLALPPAQLDAARAAYANPPRAYHDFRHVGEVLRQCLIVAAGPGWSQPREVGLAVLYHDAIYTAGRADNEARSAALAADEIGRWLPDAGIDVGRVVELIDLTARHGQFAPADFADDARGEDSRHFLDCDMAILGADPAAFDAYDAGIAAEYRGVVPGWLFRRKRRQFLKALLEQPRIYLGDLFHARYDAAARDNLRRTVEGRRRETR